MYQTIGKNKWDMYANCKYMQKVFAPSLVASQKPPLVVSKILLNIEINGVVE
jgi:hypothetical protein